MQFNIKLWFINALFTTQITQHRLTNKNPELNIKWILRLQDKMQNWINQTITQLTLGTFWERYLFITEMFLECLSYGLSEKFFLKVYIILVFGCMFWFYICNVGNFEEPFKDIGCISVALTLTRPEHFCKTKT